MQAQSRKKLRAHRESNPALPVCKPSVATEIALTKLPRKQALKVFCLKRFKLTNLIISNQTQTRSEKILISIWRTNRMIYTPKVFGFLMSR